MLKRQQNMLKGHAQSFFFLPSHMYKLIHPDVLVFITDVKNTQTLQSHAVFLLTVTSIWKHYSGKAAKCFTEHFFKNDSPYNSIQTCIRRKQPVWGQACLILTFLQAQTEEESESIINGSVQYLCPFLKVGSWVQKTNAPVLTQPIH